MNRYRISWLPAVFAATALLLSAEHAAAQEVGLAPLDVKEVARGYRAEALKLKPVVNDKNETIGKISDYIFSKEGNNVYAVLAVDDSAGPGSHLVAIPFRQLKLDDPSGYIVLPGASADVLQKLPVFVYNSEQSSASTLKRR
ncbi:MAG: photosystem reaction center subunit [Bradyrhizobium sp.]|jgi:PRC-barrel domain|nr:photosystem reaction center subunit [Bradyrhizobium sp.]